MNLWGVILVVLGGLGASSARAAEENIYTVKLKWKPVQGVSKYRIQIGHGKSIKPLINQASTDGPEWTWSCDIEKESGRGLVFYRVASIGEDGSVGAFSASKEVPLPQFVRAKIAKPSEAAQVAEPTPVPTPEAPAAQITRTVTSRWEPTGSLQIGVGSQYQSSAAADLKSARTIAPFVQQRFRGGVRWKRKWEIETRVPKKKQPELTYEYEHYEAQLEFQWIPYAGLTDPRIFDQAKFSDTYLSLDAFRRVPSQGGADWRWGAGLNLDRSFRWVKTGVESVVSQGGYSVGPVGYLLYDWESVSSRLKPHQLGFRLAVPLTGLLTSTQSGARFRVWGEWALFRAGPWVGDLRIEGDASYERWSQPANTGLLNWSFWIAPTFYWSKSTI